MPDFSWLKNVSPGAEKMMGRVKQAQARNPVHIPYAPGTPVKRPEAPTLPAVGMSGFTAPTDVPAGGFSGDMIGIEAGQVTQNFNINEFRCKGSGRVQMSRDVITRLQQLRDHLNVPITVTSGYRSPEHNRRVNGADGSLHTKGMAADIVANGVPVGRLVEAAKQFFPTAVAYSGHVHVDIGPSRSW